MSEEKKYLFGPVPSRRLGLSLGVDIVPFKACTLDCVYCQLGKTSIKTIERKDYVPVKPVLAQLRERIADGLKADFITISGSGEPTLNSQLGKFVDGIKKITNIPVAIITNGTLLYRADVRRDCSKADLVVPSLDCADQEVFEKINRPHKNINIEMLIDGLCKFREEFSGQIWLEVFLIEGINTNIEEILKIKDIIRRIGPDKVHLNTAVRPTAESGIKKLSDQKLRDIAKEFGKDCEIVTNYSTNSFKQGDKKANHGLEGVLSMLKRRPCSLNDICIGLGIHTKQASKHIGHLQQQGVVDSEEKDGTVFFKAK